jgi:hypothetical protein
MSISKPCPMDLDQNQLIFSTHSPAVVNAIMAHQIPFPRIFWSYEVGRMDYEAGGMPVVSPECFWPGFR